MARQNDAAREGRARLQGCPQGTQVQGLAGQQGDAHKGVTMGLKGTRVRLQSIAVPKQYYVQFFLGICIEQILKLKINLGKQGQVGLRFWGDRPAHRATAGPRQLGPPGLGRGGGKRGRSVGSVSESECPILLPHPKFSTCLWGDEG